MCPMHGRIARLGRWTAGPVTAWAPAGAVAAGGNDIESLNAAPKNVSQALARATVSTSKTALPAHQVEAAVTQVQPAVAVGVEAFQGRIGHAVGVRWLPRHVR